MGLCCVRATREPSRQHEHRMQANHQPGSSGKQLIPAVASLSTWLVITLSARGWNRQERWGRMSLVSTTAAEQRQEAHVRLFGGVDDEATNKRTRTLVAVLGRRGCDGTG